MTDILYPERDCKYCEYYDSYYDICILEEEGGTCIFDNDYDQDNEDLERILNERKEDNEEE